MLQGGEVCLRSNAPDRVEMDGKQSDLTTWNPIILLMLLPMFSAIVTSSLLPWAPSLMNHTPLLLTTLVAIVQVADMALYIWYLGESRPHIVRQCFLLACLGRKKGIS